MILTPTRPYKYEIGQSISNDKKSLLILSKETRYDAKRKQKIKWYKTSCSKCGWDENWVKEYFITDGTLPCACCHGKTVVEGINDIPTTDEWMVQYFKEGREEAKQYTKASTSKIVVVCPHCNKEKSYSPHDISRNNGIGCVCGDGYSFPEKVVFNILRQLGVENEPQYRPNWGEKKRYDFYIPSLNLIIETHGIQHYKQSQRGRSLEEEQLNDKNKKDLALSNGITHYIELDCSKSTHEWIKSVVLESELSYFLNLKIIDWNLVFKQSHSNIVKEVCETLNKNPYIPIKELSRMFNLTEETISKYLKQGNNLGWCSYNPREHIRTLRSFYGDGGVKKVEVYKNGERLGVHHSTSNLVEVGEKVYGEKFKRACIQAVCRGERKSHKGYQFKYAN